jgi:SAM-dependent methyltransferase
MTEFYDPSIFNVDSVDQAKRIILTPDGIHTPEERWVKETAYLLDLIGSWIPIRDATCLDYGCGIGRLAKPLIEQRYWSVLGVDISLSMRSQAVHYVNSPSFVACDPLSIDLLTRFGVQFDVAIAIWALQHVDNVFDNVARIKKVLKPGGRLFVLNAAQRFVPVRRDDVSPTAMMSPWVDDGVSVLDLLANEFVQLRLEMPDSSVVPGPNAFWGVYEKECRLPS